jgi:hypothetical protein
MADSVELMDVASATQPEASGEPRSTSQGAGTVEARTCPDPGSEVVDSPPQWRAAHINRRVVLS